MNRQEILQTFVLGNEFKEGDLAVGGQRDEHVRHEAKARLSALRLAEIARTTFVEDGVTETLARQLDSNLQAEINHLTVGELKNILLSREGALWARRYRHGLASEVIAGVVKVMTNDELSRVAQAIFNPLPGETIAVGSAQHFGSRIQPNSPGDDEEEILFSILEGLSYGCGDVILGLNPASDDLETIIRLEKLLHSVTERLRLPTRYCVLSDIVKQSSARAKCKVDVGFQSLAGTSKAINGMVGLSVEELLELACGFPGLYFETGQGSEVTNNAAEGLDMLTLEARTYGVARYLQQRTGAWTIVNDVAGFIGPEVFRTGDQLLRACLEDMVMAKLHGLTMGLDVCSTFHMGIEPAELQRLTGLIVKQAAPAYLMAVAGQADPMLGYLTTSFRDHPRLRRQTGKRVSGKMSERLIELGLMASDGVLLTNATTTATLYAEYMKAGGDTRSTETLCQEGAKKIERLRHLGYDLCNMDGPGDDAPPHVESRIEAIYRNAQHALYAKTDEALIRDVSPTALRVRTQARDREEYLARPLSGERIAEKDALKISALYALRRPQVQFVLSDGLNANALNENLRAVLPRLRGELTSAGFHAGEVDIVVTNGRVRAGYHVGALLDVEVIIHLIGERPGTGLNTLSAYLTYGRDPAGRSRWSPDLEHAQTTAVCGIHARGKPPEVAAAEIAACVKRMFEERCSGVALGTAFGFKP
jgi:ethanolamine ammonia-lyase large subunit